MIISPGSHILFYGDSITDAGRNRDDLDSYGAGYVNLIAAGLLSRFPGWNLKVTNKGISGNRVFDLEERLEADVLALKPNIVSIMIGINDTWRRYDSGVVSEAAEFQASYERIILTLSEELQARIVICEPFLLPVPEDRKTWREDLDPRITAIRELAWKYNLPYLPLDGIFAAAATEAQAAYWLPDGVHPSLAGHGLIADKWLNLAVQRR
jgi:lysophospholipase L1-like esterase